MLYNLFENRDFVSVFAVALLAEGVDRNDSAVSHRMAHGRSPSSRRAWIEITARRLSFMQKTVALLAEGVDRNSFHDGRWPGARWSPSSRRAWIEIEKQPGQARNHMSPSSRRAWIEMRIQRRSSEVIESPSSRRAWIEMIRWLRSWTQRPCRPPRGGRG